MHCFSAVEEYSDRVQWYSEVVECCGRVQWYSAVVWLSVVACVLLSAHIKKLSGLPYVEFSLHWPLGQFSQLVTMCVYILIPSVGDRNQKSWRLLVKEHIAKLLKKTFLFTKSTCLLVCVSDIRFRCPHPLDSWT